MIQLPEGQLQDTWGVPRPLPWVNRGQGVGLPFKMIGKAEKNICQSYPFPYTLYIYITNSGNNDLRLPEAPGQVQGLYLPWKVPPYLIGRCPQVG